jgi:hypothetical protein
MSPRLPKRLPAPVKRVLLRHAHTADRGDRLIALLKAAAALALGAGRWISADDQER